MKVVFVATGDFGELGSIHMLTHRVTGVDFLSFVPTRLAQAAPEGSKVYESGAELLGRILGSEPDLVILFSGHLLATGGLMEVGEALGLIEGVRAEGIPLATGDPFLGLTPDGRFREDFDLSKIAPAAGSWWGKLRAGLGRRRVRAKTLAGYRLLAAPLRELPHLYPVAIPEDGLPEVPRAHSFYNPAIGHDVPHEDDHWWFVLGLLDARLQQSQWGDDRFAALLSSRILESLEQFEKRVSLVAPEEVIARLDVEVRQHPRFACDSRYSFESYRKGVITAGRAFFWNKVSQSILLRIMSGGVTHFFHEGHLAAILPRAKPLVEQFYYGGCSPGELPMDRSLAKEVIESNGKESLAIMNEVRRKARAGQPPAELFKILIEQ